MRGKNGQVSDSRIRGTRHPPERKEKENIEHLILLKKLQSARKVCIPSKEQKQNMTLLYLFIFAIISFLVYRSYILGLVRLELYTCLGSYSVYPCVQWVNDMYCVGVVPIPYLSTILHYMLDRGVVCGGDISVDSCIVPLPCIGQAEQHYYRGVIAMFLIFLDNITMHGHNLVSQ